MVRCIAVVLGLVLACDCCVVRPKCLGQTPPTPGAAAESPEMLLLQIRLAELSPDAWQSIDTPTGHTGEKSTARSAADRLFDEAGETTAWKIVGEDSPVLQRLEALQKEGSVKLVAQPTLMTTSGRPAWANVGGEFPYPTKDKDGISIEYKKYGTYVEILPQAADDGTLRLDVQVRLCELDRKNAVTVDGTSIPAIRVGEMNCGANMKPGQVLLIVGMNQAGPAGKTGQPHERSKPRPEQRRRLILVRPSSATAVAGPRPQKKE